MDNKNDYQINYDDGELTLKKVFSFLKKAWIRTVVYVVIFAVLSATIGAGIYVFQNQSTKEIATLIDLNFEGASDGVDPNGANYKPYEIKDSSIVSAALANANARGAGIDVKLQSDIINAIHIEGIIPEDIIDIMSIYSASTDSNVLKEIASLKYNSTRYKISIVKPKKIGLTNTQAQLLLDEIIKEYVSKFTEKYVKLELVSTGSASKDEDVVDKDYIELYDIYYNQIRSAITYLKYLKEDNSRFISGETGKSFEDLINEFQFIIDYDLEKYRTYVEVNGISNDIELARQYLVNTKSNKQIELASVQSIVTKLKQTIEDYEFSSGKVFSGNQIIEIQPNSDQYDSLVRQLTTYQINESDLTAQISKLTNRIQTFDAANGGTEIQKATAKNMSDNIAKSISTMVALANETIADYLLTQKFNNAITTASPAVPVTTQDNFTIKHVLIMVIIAVVFAVTVSFIVTGVKGMNANDKAEKEKEVVSNEETAKQQEKVAE